MRTCYLSKVTRNSRRGRLDASFSCRYYRLMDRLMERSCSTSMSRCPGTTRGRCRACRIGQKRCTIFGERDGPCHLNFLCPNHILAPCPDRCQMKRLCSFRLGRRIPIRLRWVSGIFDFRVGLVFRRILPLVPSCSFEAGPTFRCLFVVVIDPLPLFSGHLGNGHVKWFADCYRMNRPFIRLV